MNYIHENIFKNGLSTDLENRAEGNTSFKHGENGRLVSRGSVLSFSSIKGTEEIYNYGAIVKYLGWFSFEDELLLFVKFDTSWVPPIDYPNADMYHAIDQVKNYTLAQVGSNQQLPPGSWNLEAGLSHEYIVTTKIKDETPLSPFLKFSGARPGPTGACRCRPTSFFAS